MPCSSFQPMTIPQAKKRDACGQIESESMMASVMKSVHENNDGMD